MIAGLLHKLLWMMAGAVQYDGRLTGLCPYTALCYIERTTAHIPPPFSPSRCVDVTGGDQLTKPCLGSMNTNHSHTQLYLLSWCCHLLSGQSMAQLARNARIKTRV